MSKSKEDTNGCTHNYLLSPASFAVVGRGGAPKRVASSVRFWEEEVKDEIRYNSEEIEL
jgi:hypothetical protein